MTAFTILTSTTGLILVLTGWLTRRYPPQKINSVYGYRTKSSMRNQQTWDAAKRYSSNLILFAGVALSCTGSLSLFLPESFPRPGIITGTVLTIVMSLLPIPLTESYLKKTFDREGNKK